MLYAFLIFVVILFFMEYNFSEIEQQARQKWQADTIYKVENNSSRSLNIMC